MRVALKQKNITDNEIDQFLNWDYYKTLKTNPPKPRKKKVRGKRKKELERIERLEEEESVEFWVEDDPEEYNEYYFEDREDSR